LDVGESFDGVLMDSKTYLKMSARTASSEFHEEIVDASMLEGAMTQAIDVAQTADNVKKSLFYGRPLPDGAAIQELRGKTTHLDVSAIHQDYLHAALGLFTEASELLEAVLKAMETGTLDEVNVFEELGDTEWYMAMLYRLLEKTPEEAREVNIEKLTKRFPSKFASDRAINRDVSTERSVLEDGHNSGGQ
jgi:NTP pyrophosphatase (non-canonical NTP hydrolase)